MIFFVLQAVLMVIFVFVVNDFSAQEKQAYITELAALKLQLKNAQDQKLVVREQIVSTITTTQGQPMTTLNTLNVFYYVVGVVVVCVSVYFFYYTITGFSTAAVVSECTKKILVTSPEGDKAVADVLKNIDANLAVVNNVSLLDMLSRITLLDEKINYLTFRIGRSIDVDFTPAGVLQESEMEFFYLLT